MAEPVPAMLFNTHLHGYAFQCRTQQSFIAKACLSACMAFAHHMLGIWAPTVQLACHPRRSSGGMASRGAGGDWWPAGQRQHTLAVASYGALTASKLPRTHRLLHVQIAGLPDAAALAAGRLQDSGEGVDDLMAQLQALGQG